MDPVKVRQTIRAAEEKLLASRSVCAVFSEHLNKWTDAALPDKYDNNGFDYTDGVTEAEILAALRHQQEKGLRFLKLQGRKPLAEAAVGRFGLEESETLTMLLPEGPDRNWVLNPAVEIIDSKDRDIADEIIRLELADFNDAYGEDFCRRNIVEGLRHAEKEPDLHYLAAFADGTAAAACYVWLSDGTAGLDGLHTHRDFRNRHIATTLMAEAVRRFPGRHYLHADKDDTPKEMYGRMGYRTVDFLFEYLLKWD